MLVKRALKKGGIMPYLIFLVFGLMMALSSSTIVQAINNALFGNYPIQVEAPKAVAKIETVCNGGEDDFTYIQAPPPYVVTKCDPCNVALTKAATRSAIGAAQVIGKIKSMKNYKKSFKEKKWADDDLIVSGMKVAGYTDTVIKGVSTAAKIGKVLKTSRKAIRVVGREAVLVTTLGSEGACNPAAQEDCAGYQEIYEEGGVMSRAAERLQSLLQSDNYHVDIGLDLTLIVNKSAEVDSGYTDFETIAEDSIADASAASGKKELLQSELNALFVNAGDQVYASEWFTADSCITNTYLVNVFEWYDETNQSTKTTVMLRPEHSSRLLKDLEAFITSKLNRLAKEAKNKGDDGGKETLDAAKYDIGKFFRSFEEDVTEGEETGEAAKIEYVPKRDLFEELYKKRSELNTLINSIASVEGTLGIKVVGNSTLTNYYNSEIISHIETAHKYIKGSSGFEELHNSMISTRENAYDSLKHSDCKIETVGAFKIPDCAVIVDCDYDDTIESSDGKRTGCALGVPNLSDAVFEVGDDKLKIYIIPAATSNIDYGTAGSVISVPLAVTGGVLGAAFGRQVGTGINSANLALQACTNSKNPSTGEDYPQENILVFCMEYNDMIKCAMAGMCQSCWPVRCNVPITCESIPAINIKAMNKGNNVTVDGVVWPF